MTTGMNRSWKSRWAGPWLPILAIVLAALPLEAEDDVRTRAGRHFAHALELVDEQRVEQAIAEFWRAYELEPRPVVLYNIGQANVLLGRPVEAADAFQRFLAEGGTSIDPKQRLAVEQELSRQLARIASVVIDVAPPGAEVRIDGVLVGRAPLDGPLRLAVGAHRLSLSLIGYQNIERSLSLAGGDSKSLSFELIPEAYPEDSAPGDLDVQCPIPDVHVLVDGARRGTTPLRSTLAVSSGKRTVTFHRTGFTFRPVRVDVARQAVTRVTCVHDDAAIPEDVAGRLVVRTDQDHAEVFVNGERTRGPLRLPVGLHDVQVKAPGYEPWQSTVRLEAGTTRDLRVRLAPTHATLYKQMDEATTQRSLAYVAWASGALFGAATVVHYAWNRGRYQDWEDEDARLSREWASPDVDPAFTADRQRSNDDLLDSVRVADKVTIGLGAASVIGLGAGTFLFLTGEDPSRFDYVTTTVDAHGAHLGWRGRW